MASATVCRRIVFWLTVTVHTPTHWQALILINHRHVLNIAVTNGAILTGGNMRGVTEFDMVWKQVNLLPSHWLSAVVGLSQLLNVRTVCFYSEVTVHTHVQTGNGCVPRLFHTGVAVFAIHFVLTGMEFMGKWDGLVRHVALVVTDNHFVIC